MKRLILPLIVLACAATAQATISISVPTTELEVGQKVTFSVVSDTADPYGVILCIDDPSLGDWSNLYVRPEAGSGAEILWQPLESCGTLEALSFDPGNPILPGEHFTVDYEALAVGDSTINIYDFDLNPLQQITIHQTPEPATIAMLAIGIPALLRRRRK